MEGLASREQRGARSAGKRGLCSRMLAGFSAEMISPFFEVWWVCVTSILDRIEQETKVGVPESQEGLGWKGP